MIKYKKDEELQEIFNEIVDLLFPHVRKEDVVCLRSHGSKSRGVIARCHALGKAMQLGLNRKGFYVIEIISERFDKLSNEDKIKTMIHEIMHIPKSFGGGFKHHDFVCDENIENVYNQYVNLKTSDSINSREEENREA